MRKIRRNNNTDKGLYISVNKILTVVIALLAVLVSAGCGRQDKDKNETEHEAITIESSFRNMGAFMELLNEKYPEIDLEVIPYSGGNATAYMQAQLKSGDMPDIYFTSVYVPGQNDVSDKLIDMSGYAFTDNYAEARLTDVSDNGAIYFLPTFYTCIGITYNKTLLEENGWTLPASFKELEELAPKVKEAGYNLAVNQIQYPGYGFQYMCNILDTIYLNTLEGRRWQNDFIKGKTTVAQTSGLEEAFDYLERWKNIGMLNGNGDIKDDEKTRQEMMEGNTLFMLGSSNSFSKDETTDEFGLMPYLSEDGSQNAYILSVSRYVGMNKHLEDPGNEQKLQDAIHVMEVLSTVEGLTALNSDFVDTALMPIKGYKIPDTNYYKAIENELNTGITAPFIYSGWDNIIVPVGQKMIDYIQGKCSLDEIKSVIDDNQYLLKNNDTGKYTTVTSKLDINDCARLVGIAYADAVDADISLISKNKWFNIKDNSNLNTEGVSGSLFELPVTDMELTSIAPTGWTGTINTVTLTGKDIKELSAKGYDKYGNGNTFPYEVVKPESLEIKDDKEYKVVICGATKEIKEKGKITDTNIIGLNALRNYVSQFDTLSKEKLVWE